MPFRPGTPRRERILAMGPPNSGKTRMWLAIAKKYEQLKSPGTFYVLDSDLSLEAMLGGEEFGVLLPRTQWMRYEPSASGKGQYVVDENRGVVENPRLVVLEPYDWPDYVDAIRFVQARETNDDWTVVDMVSPVWGEVQNFYIDLIHRKDTAEFYLAARQANAKGNPLDGDKDWSNINRLYREFSGPLMRLRGHLFLTASVKEVQLEGARADKKDVRVTFGAHGVKPEGQKHTHHTVHTIILAQEFRPNEWIWTTIKDRERPKLVGAEAKDFAMEYLVKLGGWKLA